jgi:hypothetical protein
VQYRDLKSELGSIVLKAAAIPAEIWAAITFAAN